jgi:hypothetical protein
MIDTGAAVNLFDAELASALGLKQSSVTRRLSILGISGAAHRIPFWQVDLWILPWQFGFRASVEVGFVPQLGSSVGNVLGREFLELIHFGLDQSQRTLYLGGAARSQRRR